MAATQLGATAFFATMVDEDSMEISSEHDQNGDEDIDIDIDLTTGQNDEDSILDDVDGFDTNFQVHPSAETDDPMLEDDDRKSFPMEDLPFEEMYNQHEEVMSFSEAQPPTDRFGDGHNPDTETFAGDAILGSEWEPSIISGEQNEQAIIQQVEAQATNEASQHDDSQEDAQNQEQAAEEMVEHHDKNDENTQGQVQNAEEIPNFNDEDTVGSEEVGIVSNEDRIVAHESVAQSPPEGSPPAQGPSHGNSPRSPLPIGSTSDEASKSGIETAPTENISSNHNSPHPDPPYDSGEPDDNKNLQNFSAKTDPARLHEVKASYQNGEYALFSSSELDDPDDYFLNDLSLADQPLPIFFAAFRGVIENDIPPEGEICISFTTLGLQIEEVSSSRIGFSRIEANDFPQESSFLEDVTFGQIIQLHEKLQQHDGVDSPQPLQVHFSFKPSIPRRLAYLKARVAEGKGLIGMPTMDTPLGLQPEDLIGNHDESANFIEGYGSDDNFAHPVENTNNEINDESEINLAPESSDDTIPALGIGNIDNIDTSNPEYLEVKSENESEYLQVEQKTDVDVQPLSKVVGIVGGDFDDDGDLLDYEDEELKPQKSVEKRSTDNSSTHSGISTDFITPCLKPHSCFCSKCNILLMEEIAAMDEAIRRRSLSLAREEHDETVEQAAESSNVTSEETLQEGDIIDYSDDEGGEGEVGHSEGELEYDLSHPNDVLTRVHGDSKSALVSSGDTAKHEHIESRQEFDHVVASSEGTTGEVQQDEIIDLLEDDIDLSEDTENPYRIEPAVSFNQKDKSSTPFNEEPVLEEELEDAAESDSVTINNDSDGISDPQTSYQDTGAATNDEDEIDYEDHEEQDALATPESLLETETPVLNSGSGKRPRAEADFEDVSSTRSNGSYNHKIARRRFS